MRRLYHSCTVLFSLVAVLHLVSVSPVFGAAPEISQTERTDATDPLEIISSNNLGRRVTVRARVQSVLPPISEKRPYRILLKAPNGSAAIVVWPETWQRLGWSEALLPDTTIEATVDVINNSNAIEGNVARASDVHIVVTPTLLQQITKRMVALGRSLPAAGGLLLLAGMSVLFGLMYLRARRILSLSQQRLGKAMAEREASVAHLSHLLRASASVVYTLKPSRDVEGISKLTYMSDSLEQTIIEQEQSTPLPLIPERSTHQSRKTI